jgi:methyl-accepting chemotaxis protein
MLRKMKIGTKINFIFLVIILIFSIVIGFTATLIIENGMEERILAKVKSDNALGFQYLNEARPGNWEIKNNELVKGETTVNGTHEIVDNIKKLTGSEATLFQGDVRISTTIKEKNGERDVNTKASPEVSKVVLEKGKSFHGEADILGKDYIAEYLPIKNPNGDVIGMWLVAYPKSSVIEMTISFIKVMAIVLVTMLILSVIATSLFSRNLKKRIGNIVNLSKQIAAGDLTSKDLLDKEQDEIGELTIAVNEMSNNLRNVIQQVTQVSETVNSQSEELTQSANEVKTGAEQVASTMQELASGSETQANSASDLSTVMSTFTEKVQEVNENGERIGHNSKHVLDLTKDGSNLMEKSIMQMEKIDQIVQESVQKVQSLDKQSQQISNIVTVIKDVADQTNLLALNAAIEAARAGEHGKGFAVVADEVRKLAEQVSDSVTDITEIVTTIQSESRLVSESLLGGYKEVELGTTQIETTGHTFEDISDALTEMANNITTILEDLSEIEANTHEMNVTIEEIAAISEESAAGIEETTASTQQTSSIMEEVAGNSEQLALLAEKLNGLVRQFKL